jgi:hypothetical protein
MAYFILFRLIINLYNVAFVKIMNIICLNIKKNNLKKKQIEISINDYSNILIKDSKKRIEFSNKVNDSIDFEAEGAVWI